MGGYLNNNTASGWYGSLSSTWQNMIEDGAWYLRTVGSGMSYKASICATVNPIASGGTKTSTCSKTTISVSAKVGLPRLGEMFASRSASSPESSENMIIITPKDTSTLHTVNSYGSGASDAYYLNFPARPSIYLKSSVIITGGDGTPSNPFTLTM